VEDGVNTALECSDFILSALESLADESTDTATVTAAECLLKKLQEFDFIISLHMLKLIFQTTGPASRIIQSVAVDMAVSAQIVCSSIDAIEQHHQNKWDAVVDDATKFASHHRINQQFTQI